MVDERRLDVFARTVTAIDEGPTCQHGHGLAIGLIALALSNERAVRYIPEPVQILEDARLVFGTTALSVVILDPQEDAGAGSPDILGVEHVPQVEPSRRRRGEACEHRASIAGSRKPEAGSRKLKAESYPSRSTRAGSMRAARRAGR
jgi:hypothetical protein